MLVGRYKQAAESLQHIKKMRNSPNSKHHLNLGQCYKAAGVKAQAFDELERSINLNPNDSNLFEMAEFMLQDDKRDEAIRYLRHGSNQFAVFVHPYWKIPENSSKMISSKISVFSVIFPGHEQDCIQSFAKD